MRILHIDKTVGNQNERMMVRFCADGDAACGGGYVCSYFRVLFVCKKLRPCESFAKF